MDKLEIFVAAFFGGVSGAVVRTLLDEWIRHRRKRDKKHG